MKKNSIKIKDHKLIPYFMIGIVAIVAIAGLIMMFSGLGNKNLVGQAIGASCISGDKCNVDKNEVCFEGTCRTRSTLWYSLDGRECSFNSNKSYSDYGFVKSYNCREECEYPNAVCDFDKEVCVNEKYDPDHSPLAGESEWFCRLKNRTYFSLDGSPCYYQNQEEGFVSGKLMSYGCREACSGIGDTNCNDNEDVCLYTKYNIEYSPLAGRGTYLCQDIDFKPPELDLAGREFVSIYDPEYKGFTVIYIFDDLVEEGSDEFYSAIVRVGYEKQEDMAPFVYPFEEYNAEDFYCYQTNAFDYRSAILIEYDKGPMIERFTILRLTGDGDTDGLIQEVLYFTNQSDYRSFDSPVFIHITVSTNKDERSPGVIDKLGAITLELVNAYTDKYPNAMTRTCNGRCPMKPTCGAIQKGLTPREKFEEIELPKDFPEE